MSWLQNLRKDPKKVKALICATIIMVVAAILCAIQPLYSGDIDNYGMALVANKRFAGAGQDGYIYYLHPILCKIFEVVHWMFPKADAFSLVAETMLLMGIWWISYYLYVKKKNNIELLVEYLVLFSFILIGNLFNDNFTRWAAFFCMIGMLTLLCNNTKKKSYCFVGTFYVALGMMWRQEVLIIYIPFLLLMFLAELIQKQKTERMPFLKQTIGQILVPLICIVVLLGCKIYIDHSETYREAVAYDDARSAVVDYPSAYYDDVASEMPGVSWNDYYAILNWFFLDTDYINTSLYETIDDASSIKPYTLTLPSFKLMLSSLKDKIMTNTHLFYLCVLLGSLLVIGFLAMNWYYKIEFVLMFLGMDFILLYLTYAGRGIVRAFYPVIYATIISVVVILKKNDIATKAKYKWAGYGVLVLVAFLGIGRGVSAMTITTDQSVWQAGDDEAAPDWMESDRTYVWSCSKWAKTLAQATYIQEGKLIPEVVMQRNIPEGNWFYGQVFFDQYLEKIGVDNPIDVVMQEDAYYVGDNCLFLLYYLQEHVDYHIQAEQVGDILEIPVWDFYVAE